MTTVEILSRLRQLEVTLRLHGDRLIIDAPKGVLTQELQAELSRQKSEIVSLLRLSAGDANGEGEIRVERAPREGTLPLSVGQEGLWFLNELSPEALPFLVSAAVRLTGQLDVEILRESLEEVVRRHESLRTVFPCADGTPYAKILAAEPVEIPVIDLRDLAPVDRDAELLRLINRNVRQPFDLACGPTWSMKLVRLGEREHVLLGAVHHIVFDGWSAGIFVREMIELYAAALERRSPAIASLPFQFADYVQWQKRRLETGGRERNLAYWKAQLAGRVQPLELPVDRPRVSDQNLGGAKCSRNLSVELREKLKVLGQSEGASLFMALLAAFQLFLHRLTHQDHIIVGTPVASRDLKDTENLIGFFANVVAMRGDFLEPQTFRQLLRQVKKTALESFVHQDMPHEELVAAVDPERDLTRNPLYQVVLNHMNLRMPTLRAPGLTIDVLRDRTFETKSYLHLYVFEDREGLELFLLYDANMFDAIRVEGILCQYQMLLEGVAAAPDRLLEEYSLVTPSMALILPDPKCLLEVSWEGSVHERFLEQAARRPEAIAISELSGDWTYAQLERLSGGLAAWLERRGIGPGDIVAIYGHRSAPLVMAMLGVLRAGAAFCIIDPAYPASRLCRNFEAVRPKGWLQIAGAEDPPESLRAIVEKEIGNCRLKLPRTYAETRAMEWAGEQIRSRETDPDTPAYATFTSGTTGEPKWVIGTHRPLSHFVVWQCEQFGLADSDRFSMLSGLAHDPLLRDIFTPLWLGAALCIPEADEILSPGYLAEWMQKRRVTVSHLTPSMGTLMTESATTELPALRYAFFGGELLMRGAAAKLRRIAPFTTVVNFYGATETPQAMAWHEVDPAELGGTEDNARLSSWPIPIGKSIPGVQLLIVNRSGELAGVGEIGEIYVRTPYLTLGYAKDAELTRERFVVNPFGGNIADRLYRTGDLGRYNADGIVEFGGRGDQQVKIRGQRVELGEIEATITGHESVRQCVVVARKERADDLRLIAYVVSSEGVRPTLVELRNYLIPLLPDYMLPSAVVFLDAMPLTPNGKVDRGALPAPASDLSHITGEYAPPSNQVERAMAEIWSEVLGVQKIGIFENFFELGGHSLTATRLIARVRSSFQMDFALRSIFVEPTIAGLSKHILYDDLLKTYRYMSEIPSPWKRLVPGQPKGSRTPLFLVAGFMGADDTLLVLSRIFPHLGFDQPVFGFQPRWLDGHSKAYASVEEAALEFVAELREFQPHGPYFLGGDCAQGVVALEMARELKRQGQEVGLLVMFDSIRPTRFHEFLGGLLVLYRRSIHAARTIGGLVSGKSGSRAEIIRKLFRRKFGVTRPKGPEESAQDIVVRSRMDYWRMILRHRVQNYPGRITLIMSESQPHYSSTGGWKGVALGGLEVHPTPGDHVTRFTTHSAEFAIVLRKCLERAEAQTTSGTAGMRDSSTNVGTDRRIDDGTLILSADARH